MADEKTLLKTPLHVKRCDKGLCPCRGDACEIADRVEYWLYYRYQKTVEAGNLQWYLGEKYNTESAALDAAKRESERWYMSGGQYEYKVCKVTCKHEPIAHYVNGEKR